MTVRPAPAHLQGSVAALWELQGELSGRSTGLPKPFAELVISLSGFHLWRSRQEAAPISFSDGWLTPVQAAPRFAETVGRLHLVGVRLHPAAAAHLFGPAKADGPAYPIPLYALLGSEESRLRLALLHAEDTDERFRVLASWLSARLDGAAQTWLPSVHDLGRLRWRVDELARELGLSGRGLHKRFVQELGVGPKLWLQLGRFDAVLRCRPVPGSLADLAAAFGYADQAHLTTDFRRFAGLTPGAYIHARTKVAAPCGAPHLVPAAD
jgi:AraC-like DNA-binding protein